MNWPHPKHVSRCGASVTSRSAAGRLVCRPIRYPSPVSAAAPPWSAQRFPVYASLSRGFCRPSFFAGRPALLPPDAKRVFVALSGALAGALHAVAQAMEETADRRGIVGHPKGASVPLADPLARPGLPAQPVRFRPTIQERRHLGALFQRELGRRAGGRGPDGDAALPLPPALGPVRATG